MTIERFFTQPIVIGHRTPTGAKDSYGNAVYGVATSTTVLGYAEIGESTENSTDRDTADTPIAVYLPAGTVVSKRDTITLTGSLAGVWYVDGDPAPITRPTTNVVHHIELSARRVL